jgi:hypothetical protein
MQFLKINELMESHRVSYVSYAKLSRSIQLELSLPISERSQHGSTMVDICGNEYSRLIEQSPTLPKIIMDEFENKFGIPLKQNNDFTRPEFMDIKLISPFKGTKEKNIMDAAISEISKRFPNKKETQFQNAKDSVLSELRKLREKKSEEVSIEVPTHSLSMLRLAELFNFEDEVDEHSENSNMKK